MFFAYFLNINLYFYNFQKTNGKFFVIYPFWVVLTPTTWSLEWCLFVLVCWSSVVCRCVLYWRNAWFDFNKIWFEHIYLIGRHFSFVDDSIFRSICHKEITKLRFSQNCLKLLMTWTKQKRTWTCFYEHVLSVCRMLYKSSFLMKAVTLFVFFLKRDI